MPPGSGPCIAFSWPEQHHPAFSPRKDSPIPEQLVGGIELFGHRDPSLGLPLAARTTLWIARQSNPLLWFELVLGRNLEIYSAFGAFLAWGLRGTVCVNWFPFKRGGWCSPAELADLAERHFRASFRVVDKPTGTTSAGGHNVRKSAVIPFTCVRARPITVVALILWLAIRAPAWQLLSAGRTRSGRQQPRPGAGNSRPHYA